MTQPDTEDGADRGLEDLLVFIRDARGFDFTGYKRSSLARRIRKRMQEAGVADYVDYRDQLESSAEEFGHLFNTILINVTGFFRDTETWTFLQREIMPGLLADAEDGREIRIWSAGCASGEEAYSLTIAFAEALGIEDTAKRVKIYGTDVDDEALHDARAGLYSTKALDALPGEMRDKYFEQNGSQFAFRPDLRRRVIFGRHDLTRDAPISRLDLLVCRNTLMYFNVETQSQVIDRFHFACREGGYLFLGKAEMLLSDGERFEVVSMRQRIFRRRPGVAVPKYQTAPVRFDIAGGPEVREVNRKRQLRDMALDSAPFAAIGVDAEGIVALLNNQMRTLFGMSSRDLGRPFHDLEISYRPVELRSLIERAHAEHRVIRLNSVERRLSGDDSQYLDIHIHPLWGNDGLSAGVAMVFVDTTLTTRLQHEVKRNREELDTAHEELQSTNEELETTNEELQSTNDELHSANEELSERSAQVASVNAFMDAILRSLEAAVIVVDRDFQVTAWSTPAEETACWLASTPVQLSAWKASL